MPKFVKLITFLFVIFFSSQCLAAAYYQGSGNKSEYKVHGNLENGWMNSIVAYPKKFETITQSATISQVSISKQEVEFSIHIKAKNVTGWAGLWLRLEDKDGNTIGFNNMKNRPIKGTFDWKLYKNKLYVPKHAKTLVYGVLLKGAGYVQVSAYQLK